MGHAQDIGEDMVRVEALTLSGPLDLVSAATIGSWLLGEIRLIKGNRGTVGPKMGVKSSNENIVSLGRSCSLVR